MSKPRKPAVEKAPDGLPWPNPRIAVDTSEQLPYAFGFVPAAWREEAPVHHGEIAARSLVNELLGGPWECVRANLETGDYQPLSPLDGLPIPPKKGAVVERKGRDYVGSITHDRVRFMAECARMTEYRAKAIVVEAPIEHLLGSYSGAIVALEGARGVFRWLIEGWALASTAEEIEEFDAVSAAEQAIHAFLAGLDFERANRSSVPARSLLGTTLSIIVDYQIPILFLPVRGWAEYVTAWMLRRSWRRWLIEHPEGLAAARGKRLDLTGPVADPRDIDEPVRAEPAIDDAGT